MKNEKGTKTNNFERTVAIMILVYAVVCLCGKAFYNLKADDESISHSTPVQETYESDNSCVDTTTPEFQSDILKTVTAFSEVQENHDIG